jgi:SAM-dependent methyltransferase
MHDSVMNWVGDAVQTWMLAAMDTLEVGSYDVNGSVRGLFRGPYIGVDMREGPGVDVVAEGHTLPFEKARFECVVATELLEHDAAFWLTLGEIARVLQPGGHLLVTTRGNGFGEHGYPYDYWRFMPNAGPLLMELADCQLLRQHADPEAPGLFLHGKRR